MKRIWIVNYYTSSPEKCSNPRYVEFAKHFMLAGYDVIIFNSTKSERIKSDKDFVEKYYGNYHYVHVKSPDYVGNGLKRMISIWSFAWKIYRKCKSFNKPDLILHNLHTPFDFPVFWMAKRLKAKYIGEAWDLWPEDFVTFGLLSKNGPFMKMAYAVEKKLYEEADQLVFTQEGAIDYIRNKGWSSDRGGKIDIKKVHYINNGVNIDEFDANVQAHPRSDADLNDPNTYKIIYVGSVRLVNDVKQLIDAAAILKYNSKYKFFIYGDGKDREMLEQYVKDNLICNVEFKEKSIPLSEVAWVVSQATVNIMNYQKGFGLYGVSSGKMFQYFAAGKPICCNIKLNYSEISRRNLGIDKDLDTPEHYAEAISQLAEQSADDYTAMCHRVREAGEAFDFSKLAVREIEVIQAALGV